MAALVSEAEGHSLSCRCNIILEGLNRANLASRTDSLKPVQAVYRHVMDRVQGKVLVKRPDQRPSAVIHESAANHVTCRVFFRLCCPLSEPVSQVTGAAWCSTSLRFLKLTVND